ncbi:MAG: acyl-CoA thioesterase [Acidimicrobiales bacterium]
MTNVPFELASIEAWRNTAPRRRRDLVLGIERIDRDLFRGWSPPVDRRRVFGGQVVAQALVAATFSTDTEHILHSVHSYFLRAGSAEKSIIFSVDPIRSGRSFSTRRVVASQDGKAILNLECSFHRPEPGPEHSLPLPQGVPPPEESERSRFSDGLIEVRRAEHGADDETFSWYRAHKQLSAADSTDVVRQAIAVYGADHGPIGTLRSTHRHQASRDSIMAATLDHLVWLHHTPEAGEWLLHHCTTLASAAGRGITRGSVHTESGRHVATVVQEALFRPLTRQQV